MLESPRPPGAKPGRPRDARSHQAILDAATELLRETNYFALSLEGIAARAGVGKATIYRRWPSKAAVVAEAVVSCLNVGELPDTGSSREDLVQYVTTNIANYGATMHGSVMPALAAELVSNEELHETFAQRFIDTRRSMGRVLVARAVQRGDLPAGTDVELVLDMLAGTVFYRNFLSRRPSSRQVAERLVDIVLCDVGRDAGGSRSDLDAGVSRS